MDISPRHSLSADQWERIEPLLPVSNRAETPARTVVEAGLWILGTGAPWRDLPLRFGKWNTVYKRFARWGQSGVWELVLAEIIGDRATREVALDSTAIRVQAAGLGASKKTGRKP